LKQKFPAATRFVTSHYSTIAFLAGFVSDNLTLRRVDLWLENLALIIYLTIAAVGIMLINASRASGPRIVERYAQWFPLAVQFAFGGLFSAYFVFYSRSAALAASWPFLLFLALLLVGNEFFRARYSRLVFQASVLYIALFSYAIFAVPVVLREIGVGVFLVSGLVSIAAAAFFLALLALVLPGRLREAARPISIAILSLYLLFHALYFLNLIPPLPLALREIGIYQSVERVGGGGYRVLREARERSLLPAFLRGRTLHVAPGGMLYCFSAVFAPTHLTTRVFHDWQYQGEKAGGWVSAMRVSFPIAGGRDGGYRGFSFKREIVPGEWRCDVETEHGALIGRRTFTVVTSEVPPVLIEDVR
jgi:hypothetical protein